MGCIQSKKDSGDIHPNVFRVVNIDEGGAGLWSGQLEVTETDLVLYREGRDMTAWPLRCLRRYGFDGEIFSFESGRRCTTGEGIYAFRCRRAGMLFRTLQQNIQLRNMINESSPLQLPPLAGNTASLPRSMQPGINSIHRGSMPAQFAAADVLIRRESSPPPTAARPMPSVLISSPRSPSAAEIHEVLPLFPLASTSNANHKTNLYQKDDFRLKEYNNNRSELQAEHSYSNDFNRDLAALRMMLQRETTLNTTKNTQEEKDLLKNQYMNEGIPLTLNPPLSPTTSETSEYYARLTVENANDRLYMNLAPNVASQRCIQETQFSFSNRTDLKLPPKEEMNTYANVNVGDVLDHIHSFQYKQGTPESVHKLPALDAQSISTQEDPGVNYAVLDMDNKDSPASPDSYSSSRNEVATSPTANGPMLASQNSIEKTGGKVPGTALGYTTIDFDKTVALTSVASGTEVDTEGSRKTRHNSVNFVTSSNGI